MSPFPSQKLHLTQSVKFATPLGAASPCLQVYGKDIGKWTGTLLKEH